MYQVLIVVNEPAMKSELDAHIDWTSVNFRTPLYSVSANDAIALLETKRIDCIAYMLDAAQARVLYQYLTSHRPSLPTFELRREAEEQLRLVTYARKVLDNLHMDMSDEEISEEVILDMLRDELTHSLLAGEVEDEAVLRGRFEMLRTDVSVDKPCLLYDFDLPQGEVYLHAKWHYGSERLENALRVNFFGRYYGNLFYCVAVLNPRHIRVLACQRKESAHEPLDELCQRADEHTQQVLESIKDYLNLDMRLTERIVLPSMCALVQ